MKILLTGATGYIGKRLLPILVDNGHEVTCCVRDIKRFNPPASLNKKINVIEFDILDNTSLKNIPKDIDGVYYLVHSISPSREYESLEKESAINFRKAIDKTNAKHVVFLGCIINEASTFRHLTFRKNIESELSKGNYNFTSLRAGIIIGSGSYSFEIIRDLVEKLPFMVAPKWIMSRCQPIGVSDVILILSKTLFNSKTFNQDFDIGGPDILSFEEMLLEFGQIRNLKRKIFNLPMRATLLSTYWLYLVTSTSYKLSVALVNSMKADLLCRDNKLNEILNITPVSYKKSLSKAFAKIQSNAIISSWRDSLISGGLEWNISDFVEVPVFGCFIDKRERYFNNFEECTDKIWQIGGNTGWYYGNWLWQLRGFLDKLFFGVGLKRGRTNKNELTAGDALDFWRVLYADKKEGRLLLFGEMKSPGEAWLEFRIKDDKLIQTATFRPKGIFGRLYWYSVYPFHEFIFKGMINGITKTTKPN